MHFSRFIVSVPARNLRPTHLISSMGEFRVPFLGNPNIILKDGGRGTISREWKAHASANDVAMVVNPPHTAFRMGPIERHVWLLKQEFKR